MRTYDAFDRRPLRTERVILIQSTCAFCGFTAVGHKLAIEATEAEHRRRCVRKSRRSTALIVSPTRSART